jgi:hypothetical protein
MGLRIQICEKPAFNMKKLIPLVLLAVSIFFQSQAQKKQTKQPAVTRISLSPDRWAFQEGKVEFIDYKGQRAMKIGQESGQVVLKDLVFKDGTIEYDVESIVPEFANSVYFHRKDQKEQEIVYLRVARLGNKLANEAIQYCPYFDGINMWDMYPQYQGPAPGKIAEWNHIKLVIAGKQMRVFVNGARVLEVPKLEGNETEGSIAFDGASYIANIEIKPGETEGLSPAEGADLTRHEANYIRTWAVSQPVLLPAGSEPASATDLPKNESFTEKLEAERAGFINLTRRFGANPKRKITWMRSVITTNQPVKTSLQLGFSDEIWVYLNNQLTYVDKNIFQQNMRKYPDGRLSVQNGNVRINLKQGENDLLIGVANDFYGWGMMARLESMEGISGMDAYHPPAKKAIENIDQYLGIYAAPNVAFKLVFTQKNGELFGKATNVEPIPFVYAGNHVFKEEKMGVELIFKPAEKKVILKDNGSEREFTKE